MAAIYQSQVTIERIPDGSRSEEPRPRPENNLEQAFPPGLCAMVFKALKMISSNIPFKHRFCVLLVAEIELERYNYNSEEMENLNTGLGRTNAFADTVIVFMLRSIFGHWKQPLGFMPYDRPMQVDKLVQYFKQIVRSCFLMHINIIASVFPCTPTTMHAYDMLIDETFGTHPYKNGVIMINGQEVIPLFDPSSLFKDFRSNLISNDLFFKVQGVEAMAKWHYIQKAYEIDRIMSYGYLFKISERHVVPERIDKGNLTTCIETFSMTVSSFLRSMAGKHLPKEARHTGDLLFILDSVFDSLNGFENLNQAKPLKELVRERSAHFQAWKEAKVIFGEMQFIQTSLGFKENVCKGWVKALDGFINLRHKILNDIGYKEFAAKVFNLDGMQSFFEVIKILGEVDAGELLSYKKFITAYTRLMTDRDVSFYLPGYLLDYNDGLPFLITFLDINDRRYRS